MTTPALVRGTPPASSSGSSRRPEETTRIAAIDIGSNSIRQLVADVSADGTISVVDEMKAAPRLGAGLEASGELSEESMTHATEALISMATLAKQLGAKRVEVVATSAVRDARNAEFFIARVRQEAKLRIRILTGYQEAKLSFRSAMAHFDLAVGRAAVVDIGGGSLELALSADGILDQLVSLPLGAVRLTERYLSDGGGARGARGLRRLRRDARSVLRAFPVREWRGTRIIGSGGTFTNLAGIVLARQGMAIARTVHGTTVSRGDVEHVVELLAGMSVAERREVAGLNPGRADIIVAGLAVLAELMARLDARHVVVSRYGIREGLLLDAARVAPVAADPGEARERSVRDFAGRCQIEWPHAEHVRVLALRLFDAIGARLQCDPEDRQLLADAAMLHDAGYHISYDRHHKHSYHLIMHAELLGIAPANQVALANIARYHRGATPKKAHRAYAALDKSIRKRIKRLAAILRVADGLDRGHMGAVKDLKVRWMRRAIRITPVPADSRHQLRLELLGGQRKSDLLAELAGVPVELVAPDGSVFSSDSIEDASVDANA